MYKYQEYQTVACLLSTESKSQIMSNLLRSYRRSCYADADWPLRTLGSHFSFRTLQSSQIYSGEKKCILRT